MINWISSWVQGIVIAVIISTIIEMILPNGNIKKYVRTAIGAYIVFVIISPIITKITGKEITLSSYKLPETKQTIASIDTNSYIESTYINKIKQDIISNIEKKQYSVSNINVDIEKDEKNYGKINKIDLVILKKEETKKSNIEPVKIEIKSSTKKQETITKEEIETLKKELKETYGTEKIKINERWLVCLKKKLKV